MRRRRRKQASERLWRRAFGPQIDKKGCFSGRSPARHYEAAANVSLRKRFRRECSAWLGRYDALPCFYPRAALTALQAFDR
jgi:hypothetical protein